MNSLRLCVLALVACGWLTTPAAGQVAHFLEIKGKSVVIAANGRQRTAMVYGGIRKGEELRLERETMVVLAWASDGRFERLASRDKDIALKVWENKLEGAMPEVIEFQLERKKLIVAGVGRLPPLTEGGVSVPRGDPDQAAPPQVVPIHRSLIIEAQPQFEWPAVEGAATYQIACRKQGASPWKLETKEPRATYKGPKFTPGAKYVWSVTAVVDGKVQSVVEAEFTFAATSVLMSVPRYQTVVLDAEMSNEPSVVALIAMRYEQQALLALALDAYSRLAKLTPNSPAVHAALADMYARAGRARESQAHRKRAEELGFTFGGAGNAD